MKTDRKIIQQRYREKHREELRLKNLEYKKANKEKVAEYNKAYKENNKEKVKAQAKIDDKRYRERHAEKIAERKKKYAEENKEQIREYYRGWKKNRMANDPLFLIQERIRNSIYKSLRHKTSKNQKTEQILGCSFDEFKSYLETKFELWMNWENYGRYNGEANYGWDIDHIIPLSIATTEEELIKLNHYTNLQPLCSYINRDVKKHFTNFPLG